MWEKGNKWKVYEWKKYEWKVYELKIVQNGKQPSNVLQNKINKKVVPSDSKCTWSNVNLGYGNVTIQL